MKPFFTQNLLSITQHIEQTLLKKPSCEIEVLNPDLAQGLYAGELFEYLGEHYVYRSYRNWHELALSLNARLLTPERVSKHTVKLSFTALEQQHSFHKETRSVEKYGTQSTFFRLNKTEEASFMQGYKRALEEVGIHKRLKVLNLGINKADEFVFIKELIGEEAFSRLELVGIDFCPSAIEHAKKTLALDNVHFVCHDITKLEELDLGTFDLIISIGTLQSAGINLKTFFMSLVQKQLKSGGAVLLGFPNCRWFGGEMVYGAKVPNYVKSEQSTLYKDVYFCKKYLQQKKFRVVLQGKEYLFLSATSLQKNT